MFACCSLRMLFDSQADLQNMPNLALSRRVAPCRVGSGCRVAAHA
jgi:hypothetical protein